MGSPTIPEAAPFIAMPAALLDILLHVAVEQMCEYGDAAAAGVPLAQAINEVGARLFSLVVLALKIRAHRGDTASQGVLDEFDRWFYTTGERPAPH